MRATKTFLTLSIMVAIVAVSCPLVAEGSWPSWRGPDATGWSPVAQPPLSWSESENIRWKTALPGKGHSSPVVWEGQVFVTTAIPLEDEGGTQEPLAEGERPGPVDARAQRFMVLAIARDSGKIRWRRLAAEAVPAEGTHRDGTWASASPVTDGRVLLASFGSQGLYAYNLEGGLLWSRDLGDMQTRRSFGEGSSPSLHGDTVVVNWDHEGASFITALDIRTGEEIWRRERDEPTSWSTPLVVEVDGRAQVVVAASGASRGYDLATGEVLWELGGLTLNVVPSPAHRDGMVYLMSGFRGNALQALRLAGAEGEVAGGDAIAFTHDRHTPYVPSALVTPDRLYFLKTNTAILTVLDAKTGEVAYTEQRIDGLDNVYSSIVGAAGRVYLTGRNGMTVVLREGDEYEVLDQNQLEEGFEASPALAGREIFLRGPHHLYSIAETE